MNMRSLSKFPQNKTDISACLKTEDCFLEKNKILTHVTSSQSSFIDQKYTSREWLALPTEPAVVRFHCLKNYEQEPYFIVKYTPNTGLYEEGYINYGFNKIEYFEYLRLQGAHFYLIAQSFAVDVPHPEQE